MEQAGTSESGQIAVIEMIVRTQQGVLVDVRQTTLQLAYTGYMQYIALLLPTLYFANWLVDYMLREKVIMS